FQVRPGTRAEVCAPVAGWVEAIYFDEGDRVSPAALLARLEVPDLASRIAQKHAEVHESQAKLRLLETGTRAEELREQRGRVARAKTWRDLAEKDLTRGRQVLQADLGRLDKQIAQYRAELDYAKTALARVTRLRARGAASEDDVREVEKRCQVYGAQQEQAQA